MKEPKETTTQRENQNQHAYASRIDRLRAHRADDEVCWVCGGPVLKRHCKIVCRVCGFTRDCSDP